MGDMTLIEEPAPLSMEFAAVDFGDTRLGLRFWRILEAVAEKPAASFPRSMGGDAGSGRVSTRFVNNRRVTPTKILCSTY
jgi:hypothetical protein